MSKEVTITNENFEEEVLNSEKPVLVDFWAEWCGPCKMTTPIIKEISEEYYDKMKIGKCNTDNNQNLTEKYGIRSIPTFILFKDGKEITRSLGAAPKDRLISIFKDHL